MDARVSHRPPETAGAPRAVAVPRPSPEAPLAVRAGSAGLPPRGRPADVLHHLAGDQARPTAIRAALGPTWPSRAAAAAARLLAGPTARDLADPTLDALAWILAHEPAPYEVCSTLQRPSLSVTARLVVARHAPLTRHQVAHRIEQGDEDPVLQALCVHPLAPPQLVPLLLDSLGTAMELRRQGGGLAGPDRLDHDLMLANLARVPVSWHGRLVDADRLAAAGAARQAGAAAAGAPPASLCSETIVEVVMTWWRRTRSPASTADPTPAAAAASAAARGPETLCRVLGGAALARLVERPGNGALWGGVLVPDVWSVLAPVLTDPASSEDLRVSLWEALVRLGSWPALPDEVLLAGARHVAEATRGRYVHRLLSRLTLDPGFVAAHHAVLLGARQRELRLAALRLLPGRPAPGSVPISPRAPAIT